MYLFSLLQLIKSPNIKSFKKHFSEKNHYIGSFKDTIEKDNNFVYTLQKGNWNIYHNDNLMYLQYCGEDDNQTIKVCDNINDCKLVIKNKFVHNAYGIIGEKTLEDVYNKYSKFMKNTDIKDPSQYILLKSSGAINVKIDVINKYSNEAFFIHNSNIASNIIFVDGQKNNSKPFRNILIINESYSLSTFTNTSKLIISKNSKDIFKNETKTINNTDMNKNDKNYKNDNVTQSQNPPTKLKDNEVTKTNYIDELRKDTKTIGGIISYIKNNPNELPYTTFINSDNNSYFIGTHEESDDKTKKKFIYNFINGNWLFYKHSNDNPLYHSLYAEVRDNKIIPSFCRSVKQNLFFIAMSKHKPKYNKIDAIDGSDLLIFVGLCKKFEECPTSGKKFEECPTSGKKLVCSILITHQKYFHIIDDLMKYNIDVHNVNLINNVNCENKSVKNIINNIKPTNPLSLTINKSQSENWIGSSKEIISMNDSNKFSLKTGKWKIFHEDIYLAIHEKYKGQQLKYSFNNDTEETELIGFSELKYIKKTKLNKIIPKECATIVCQNDYWDEYKLYIYEDDSGLLLCFALIPKKLLKGKIERSKIGALIKKYESDSD